MRRATFAHASAVEAALLIGVVGLVAIVLAVGQLSASAEPEQPAAALPTPAVGEAFALPAGLQAEIALVRTDEPPVISQQEAIDVVRAGVSIPLGDDVAATYGLGTLGHRDLGSGAWIGAQNVPLPNGAVLDRVASRPMWIVDHGNVDAPTSPGVTAANHAVYVVDAQSRAVLQVFFYREA